MKSHRKSSKGREKTIKLWTFDEVQKALPYIRSIVQSLREHHLEAKSQDRRAHLLAERPGRPDRATLIAIDEARSHARQADERFDAALRELHRLDIFCTDPIQGQAIIPFAQDNQLAWYHFDLFAEQPLQAWRFHEDPAEHRRPIEEVMNSSPDTLIV